MAEEKIANDFAKVAAEESSPGLVGEFWYFLRTNKKWWLAPVLVILALFSLLILLSATGFAPFIYPMF